MKESITLRLFTIDRQIDIADCDSVRINISEDRKGKFSGSYGIKRGHARAVFSLSSGTVTAFKGDEIVFSAETSDGFGMVEDDIISLTVDIVKENK